MNAIFPHLHEHVKEIGQWLNFATKLQGLIFLCDVATTGFHAAIFF
jgi:hypothetical protein